MKKNMKKFNKAYEKFLSSNIKKNKFDHLYVSKVA